MTSEPTISLTKEQFLEEIVRVFGPQEDYMLDVAGMIFDDRVRTGRATLKLEVYYEDAATAFNAPMEPATPCREMETRACVDLTNDESSMYRVYPCRPKMCTRHPSRDRRESSN